MDSLDSLDSPGPPYNTASARPSQITAAACHNQNTVKCNEVGWSAAGMQASS